jgi:hypothetical protein
MVDTDPFTRTSQSASSDRAIIQTSPEGVSVSIGPRGVRGGGLFLSVWLCAWLVAEIYVGYMVLKRSSQPIDLSHFPAVLSAFPVVWLAIWTIVGYYAAGRWLLAFWGYKQLIVGTTSMSFRVTMFGQSRTREFALEQVQNVRRVPEAGHAGEMGALSEVTAMRDQLATSDLPSETRPEAERALELQFARLERAARASIWSVAFDARRRTYAFGPGLSPATCQTIQDAIERSQRAAAKART